MIDSKAMSLRREISPSTDAMAATEHWTRQWMHTPDKVRPFPLAKPSIFGLFKLDSGGGGGIRTCGGATSEKGDALAGRSRVHTHHMDGLSALVAKCVGMYLDSPQPGFLSSKKPVMTNPASSWPPIWSANV